MEAGDEAGDDRETEDRRRRARPEDRLQPFQQRLFVFGQRFRPRLDPRVEEEHEEAGDDQRPQAPHRSLGAVAFGVRRLLGGQG